MLRGASGMEARAVVELLAASSDPRERALLVELARDGPFEAQQLALMRLASADPIAVGEVAVRLARSGEARATAAAVELLTTMLRRGDLDAAVELRDGLPDLFWEVQREAGESGYVPLRMQALEALASMQAPFLERRAELLIESPQVRVRRWTAARLAALPSVRERLRDDLQTVLAGESGGRDPRTVAEIAMDLLRTPARVVGRSDRGEFIVELRADLAPLAATAIFESLEQAEIRLVVAESVGLRPGFLIRDSDRPAAMLPREPWPVEAGDAILLASVGFEADVGSWQLVRAGYTGAADHSQLATVVEGIRAIERLQPGDVVTVSLQRAALSASARRP